MLAHSSPDDPAKSSGDAVKIGDRLLRQHAQFEREPRGERAEPQKVRVLAHHARAFPLRPHRRRPHSRRVTV
jgi:hypothetical protein